MSIILLSGGASGGSGPLIPPDRRTLITKPWHFQGLHVPIDNLPGWFEPALAWIDKAKRPEVYRVKEAAGDRLYGVSLSGSYLEDNVPYNQYAGYDFSKDLPGLNALVDEILARNPLNAVRLFLAGDGQGNGPGYNDPVGSTYGHDWLMANFDRVQKSLDWRCQFIQFIPGYDAIFYGWDPSQVVAFGELFEATVRARYPHAVLVIEHDIGHIPLGEGDSDYGVGKRMQRYDMVASEYNGQGGNSQCLVHDNAVWQINGRLRNPGQPYNRPSDQPDGDDPNPPAYLADGPRGETFHEIMEWATYYDSRGQCTSQAIENDRQYLRAMSPAALVA
jgi:hypothetical protein